jgi:translation initiation factor IF-2
MNITELARKLKVSPAKLKDDLPKLGFDIGKKAIKVDDRLASKILAVYRKEMYAMEKRDKEMKKRAEIEDAISSTGKNIALPKQMTVRELANTLHISVPLLMTELMKNGILSAMNERLDYDTASIVAEDLGFTVTQLDTEGSGEGTIEAGEKLKTSLATGVVQSRPPVVVVMGHVDHGKTTLLDAIRKTDVVASEAGGITQHIGAYQVHHNDKTLTFIDTPGHEAFRTMRSRGAKVADIAVLLVAADDGIKPQTKEALEIIKGANLPFVVAINKIDKPDADVEKVKGELGALNLIPEDWGGSTITVPLSAKSGDNVDKLLEMVLLVADLNQDKIVADPNARALGSVIEAHVDRGEGPVATLLIQNGTLRTGEVIVQDDLSIGKARVLKNHLGETITEAGPAMPVRILGLKDAPEVGDVLEAGDAEVEYEVAKKKKQRQQVDITSLGEESHSPDQATVPMLIKADVLGSLEAILESIAKLQHEDVRVQLIGKGLGNVTEADIMRAAATTDSFIGAFHVQIPREVKELAEEQNVTIGEYDVIYDLIAEVKRRMNERLKAEIVRTDLGKAKVLAIFRQEPTRQIIGCAVTEGLLKPKATVNIYRNDEYVGQGYLEKLQSGKEEVTEVAEGAQCGMQIKDAPKIEDGDRFELYIEEEVKRTIS